MVLTVEQAIAIALWTAHTHTIDAADCTPYLQITSATKRAGKTRLLETLEPLVAKPWLTGRVSAAALVRKVDAERPTLLYDESDATFKGDQEFAETFRGLLNSGYRASGRATICIGQGANISVKDFSTFSAKALAGIGELPGTVADRAIRIELRRRTTDEPCARWRERDGHAAAAPIRQALIAWLKRDPVLHELRSARPALPSGLDDRCADVWEPLLALADLAGADWADRARQAAIVLAGAREDTDIVVELLRDVRDILNDSTVAVIATNDLLEKLKAADDRPWATWRHDKPITGRGLARLLGPLGIHPTRLERLRGYRRDAFDDAIARYLPSQVSLRQEPNKHGPEPAISMCQGVVAADTLKNAKTSITTGEMTHGHIEQGGEEDGGDEHY